MIYQKKRILLQNIINLKLNYEMHERQRNKILIKTPFGVKLHVNKTNEKN